ncbi:hypothetical protein B9T19_00325 [Ignatzschineria sp. F8392]|uniref:outer membrane protein n=1 Tax=Ignatzschineria sp. F8392 TaxID=1980117 RepID=UPI000B97ED88|nr:outer membrane protein [Ignatzschineria sp. F8392]OYQ81160.1 hypothetical protein B9T19_00325 [Ignatzschineria sp. F8392]
MKKLLAVTVLAAVTSSLTVAQAQDFQQYVSAKAVLNHVNNKFEATMGDESDSLKKSKNVGGFRLAYGAIFPAGDNNVRAEIEYGYNGKVKLSEHFEDGDYADSKTKSQAVMLNGYFDFNTGTAFTPYVGAGLGYARLKNTLSDDEGSISKSKGNFAWQVGAGVSYAVNSNVDIDLAYRFMDYGKVKHNFGDGANLKVKQRGNEFSLGVRYNF